MEHQNILNLLSEANNSKFVARKWDTFNDNSKANYGVGRETIYKTEVLKSNLYDYSDTYIFGNGDITDTSKDCTPFTICITKIDGTTIDDTDLD